MPEQRVETSQDWVDRANWYWSLMAYVYGRTGQLERAQRALEKLEKLVCRSPSQSARTLALSAYLGLGQKEEAIALLQKAYAEHSSLRSRCVLAWDICTIGGTGPR